MKTRLVWVLLGMACAIGIAIGAAWPPPPLPKPTADGNTWSMPPEVDVRRHVPQDMATVTSGMRWNGDADNPEAGASRWRLAGITEGAGPAILVITSQNQAKAQRVSPGERLPDGSVLKQVQGDRALIAHGNCIMTYQLFHAQTINKNGGCEEPAASDQGNTK